MNATCRQPIDSAHSSRLNRPQQESGHAVTTAPTPSGSRSGPRWFVVSSYAQAERHAAHCLNRQGYETYLPMVVVQRRDRVIRSLLHRVERPLFTGYLFVQLDLRDPWGPVRNTPGVFRLLTNSDNTPEPVPEAIFRAVQAGEAFRRLPLPDQVLYRPGAPVTCLSGPFQGHDAVIISVAATTAHIALPMLGAIRELVVPLQKLTARE